MVSLATENMHSTGEEGVKSTTEALDEAGIHWTGLALKKDDIITLNGLKVGVLSFCAVYRECSDSDGLPFMPVRYSSKVAASGVKSLISVSPGPISQLEVFLTLLDALTAWS